MDASSNRCCRDRRKDQAPSVCGELVMAAVKGKMEGDGPVFDWLSMEDVPAHTCTILHIKSMACTYLHVGCVSSIDSAGTSAQSTCPSEALVLIDRQCRVPVYAVLQKLPVEHPSSYKKKYDGPVVGRC